MFGTFAALILCILIASCGRTSVSVRIDSVCSPELIASKMQVECSDLTLDQNADENLNLAKVTIPIVIVRASVKSTDKTPVFYLHGGPGGGVLDDLHEILKSDFGKDLIGKDRDWVFFDQRGTGQTTPRLDCGALALNDAGPASSEVVKQILQCADRHKKSGVDFSNYNLQAVSRDIIAIADSIGVKRFDLFGHSYGTRVAIEVMRDYPDRVNSAILDSPWTPEAKWAESGPGWVSDALGQVFDACTANENCAKKYTNLSVNTNKSMSEFLEHGKIWKGKNYSAENFAQFLMDSLYDSEAIAALPNNLTQINNGNIAPLAEYLESAQTNYDEAQHMAFLCHDELAFESAKKVEENGRNGPIDKAIAKTLINYFEVCKNLGAGKAKPLGNLPIKTNIPTLFIAAGIDPGCPASLSVAANKNFSDGQLAVIPFETHGPTRNNACARAMAKNFFSSPTTIIDMSCINHNGKREIVFN